MLSISLNIFCCQSDTQNQQRELKDTISVTHNEVITSNQAYNKPNDISPIEINDLKGTIWIHRPYKDVSDCVDTLVFQSDSIGYEYRCEFEIRNKFSYQYANDTLVIYEYGYISEVSDQGLELKYKLKYFRKNDKLILTHYTANVEEAPKSTEHEWVYKLLIKKSKTK